MSTRLPIPAGITLISLKDTFSITNEAPLAHNGSETAATDTCEHATAVQHYSASARTHQVNSLLSMSAHARCDMSSTPCRSGATRSSSKSSIQHKSSKPDNHHHPAPSCYEIERFAAICGELVHSYVHTRKRAFVFRAAPCGGSRLCRAEKQTKASALARRL